MYLVYLEEGRIHSVFGVSRDPDLCIYHLGGRPLVGVPILRHHRVDGQLKGDGAEPLVGQRLDRLAQPLELPGGRLGHRARA